jgi:hypothetical protein
VMIIVSVADIEDGWTDPGPGPRHRARQSGFPAGRLTLPRIRQVARCSIHVDRKEARRPEAHTGGLPRHATTRWAPTTRDASTP